MKDEINDGLTYKIIGCAMKVHSVLGNGFIHICNFVFKSIHDCFAIQEVIYQRALAIEFEKQGVAFQRELEMPLYYDNQHIGTRRVDFLIENLVMVELKALVKLEDVHLAQGLNYLVAYHVDKGLLLNFGAQSLEIKRLRHPKNKENPAIHPS